MLYDFTASYNNVNVHRGDAAGTTEVEIDGYGFDTSLAPGAYQCQWKSLTVGAEGPGAPMHEQSVDAFTPDSTRRIRCVSPWWDSHAATTRLTLHKSDWFQSEMVALSHE